MNRLVAIGLCVLAGFVVLALSAYVATLVFSSNSHDRDVEAVMTAMFVAGPIGAAVGAVVGARLSRRTQPRRGD
jgi:uncharacterized oligopeptide transporter (OPT) family protein